MKKIIYFTFAALIVAVGLSADSFAQTKKTHPWSVNNRQQRQQKRIGRGVKSGELTAKETYRLEKQQVQLQRTEARFRKSGDGLSWREKYILQNKLNRSSRSIYRQKHDKQSYPAPYYPQYPKKRL